VALAPLTTDAKVDAAEAPRPRNVVVILSDDQPLRSLGWMPYLSSRKWTKFTNAFLSNPLCCPSRATILTGLYSHHTGIETNSDAPDFDDSNTVATWLDEAGYRTGFVGKYLNKFPWDRGRRYVPPGWDSWVAFLGRPGYHRYRLNVDGEVRRFGGRERDYSTTVLGREALRFLSDGSEPFFLFWSPYAPHAKPVPERRYRKRFRGRRVPLPANVNERDVSDKPAWVRELEPLGRGKLKREFRDDARTLLSVDRTIRQVVKALRERDALDDTMIVYLTDNGLSLGAHRHLRKTCPYEECVKTPMLVRYPGAPRKVRSLFANYDLAPTIAELAGVEPGLAVDGESLVPLLRGATWPDRAVLLRNAEFTPGFSAPEFWGVRTNRFKYVTYPETGEQELYDVRGNRLELENLAGDPGYREELGELAERVRALRR
jgi:arylsulfatase A-like enzyme